MSALRLGLVGLGKIARDQHLPAIAATGGVELAAVASRNARADGVPTYHDVAEMLAAEPAIGAVSLCTPPQGRFEQAVAVLEAGRHLMLEKPPGMGVAEVQALAAMAAARGLSLYATWHSREAAGVEAAGAFLAAHPPRALRVTWKEDVRRWHPGQAWIWEPGGLGVFDPGINALSIVTRILPEPLHLTGAELDFPSNRGTPVAARLDGRTSGGVPVSADFDWLQTGPQTWDIEAETGAGLLRLTHGGSRLQLPGEPERVAEDREYRGLYARFVALVAAGASDVDLSPLALVADAFLLGRRREVAPFVE